MLGYTTLGNMNVKEWHQSNICIVINDKPQSSIAKHLRCDELLYYTFINEFAGEKILKLVNIWQSYRQMVVSCAHSPCTFFPKDADLAR